MKKIDRNRQIIFILTLFLMLTIVFDIAGSAPPVMNNENPYDTRDRISIYKANLSVTITDPDSTFDWTIETSPDIGSSSGNDENDGVKICNISGLQHDTVYTWYVNSTDGSDWTRNSYTFTTKKSWMFDIDGYRSNVFGWHIGAYERYLGAFAMPVILMFFITLVHVVNKDLASTVFMILLTFALYGGTNAFIQAAEYSLFFAIIAAIGIAGIILGLFMKRRH